MSRMFDPKRCAGRNEGSDRKASRADASRGSETAAELIERAEREGGSRVTESGDARRIVFGALARSMGKATHRPEDDLAAGILLEHEASPEGEAERRSAVAHDERSGRMTRQRQASAHALRPATSYAALLGVVLVYLRRYLGLSQAHVAHSMGLSGASWSRAESGFSGLSVEQLFLVAAVLQVTPAAILERVESAADRARLRGVHVEAWALTSEYAASKGMVLLDGKTLRSLVRAT